MNLVLTSRERHDQFLAYPDSHTETPLQAEDTAKPIRVHTETIRLSNESGDDRRQSTTEGWGESFFRDALDAEKVSQGSWAQP